MALDILTPLNQGLSIRGQLDRQEQARQQQDAFNQDQARQQQGRDLLSQANQGGLGSEAFESLRGFDLDSANKLKSLLQTDDQGLDAAFKDAAVFKNLLENDPTGQGALQFGAQRLQFGVGQGRNMIHTQRFMEEVHQDPVAALESIDSFLDIPNELNKRKETKTATSKDWNKFQELLSSDKNKAEQFGRKAGFIRPTEQQSSDIKVTEAERKAVIKANTARRQGFIDSGIEAANGAANISRALNLLDEVETGGFDNLALKAKRLFGVEGADEGELSNLMGKAVLAQLKPIFGAAFTAREGDALAELEAKFSNSSASNKRLLENALKLINRAARRGIAAAETQGDKFTANEIKDALAFNIDEKLSNEPKQAKVQPSNIGRFQIEVQP